MLEDVGPFLPGTKVRANWLQRMLGAIRLLGNISAAPPIRVTTGPNGIFLSMSDIDTGTTVTDAIIRSNTTSHYLIDLGHWEGSSNIATGGHFISDTGSTGAYTAYCPTLVLPVGSICQVIPRFTDTGSYYTVIQQAKESLLIPTGTSSVFSSSTSLPGAMYLATRVSSPRTTGISTGASTLNTGTLTGTSGGTANYFVNLAELGIAGHLIDLTAQNSAVATQWGFASDGIPLFVGTLNPLTKGPLIAQVSNSTLIGVTSTLTLTAFPQIVIPATGLYLVTAAMKVALGGSMTVGGGVGLFWEYFDVTAGTSPSISEDTNFILNPYTTSYLAPTATVSLGDEEKINLTAGHTLGLRIKTTTNNVGDVASAVMYNCRIKAELLAAT